jgi:hypothetical protein
MREIPSIIFSALDFDSVMGLIIIIVAISVSILCLALLARESESWFSDYALAILRRLSPPEPVVGKAYVVMKLENVYIFFIKNAPGILYFVSFKHIDSTPAESIDVQRLFWKWESKLYINELRIHHKKGHFSVPTPEGPIISGEGLLLAVSIYGRSYILRAPAFSREQLLEVADYASAIYPHST